MKRVLLIHDLCSVGKAAMMNMIPVLSVMGMEVCPLPTMLLSTHTGGFGRPEMLPVPGTYLEESLKHFQREQIPRYLPYIRKTKYTDFTVFMR